MRKRIDILISILCLISLIIAIKLSSLPPLRFVPEFILNAFLSSEEMRNEYSLLYDIAIAVFISGLFYFIVDSIPEKIKEYRAKTIIGQYVSEVESAMFHIIKAILFVYEISKSIDGLGQKDFYMLDGDTGQDERELAYRSNSHMKKRNIRVMGYGTLNTIVRDGIKNILAQIKNIREYEYLYAGNTGFMECIRNIELCSFVSIYDAQKGHACFLFSDSSKMIGEFVDLYRELKSYKLSNYCTDIEFCSEEETESYRKDREMQKGLQIVANRRAEYKRHADENRTVFVILNDNKTNNSILAYLKSCLQMECVYLGEKSKIMDINKYKVTVFLTTHITKELLNDVKYYREKQEYQGKILIIYQYKDFSSLLQKRSNDTSVQFYWIKSSIKSPILNHYYWIDEPTKETLGPLINTICKLQGADEKIIQ